ncbi:MAG: ABC transporter permease [bacterium]|nr:ABC transporter permease [bacterium]
MILYSFKLAWRSVLSSPWLSVLTILGIAIGIAVPTTLLSIRHVFASNPIPEKSDRLFNVRVDNWDPNSQFFNIKPGDPPKHIAYRDMTGLLESEIPKYATGVGTAAIFLFPDAEGQRPFRSMVRLCHADFFAMFNAPFRYGSGWSADDDTDRARVVVLNAKTNQRLFGGRDSVGELIRLGENDYTVLGVLDEWRPTPQFYDVINNGLGEPRDVFVPFDLIRSEALGLQQTGDTDGWGGGSYDTREARLDNAEFNWIQFWVELELGDVAAYRDWVDAYALTQKELGRFPKPLNNRVTPLMEWMDVRDVLPPQINGVVVISLLFLVVASLNLLGLLLAKFLSRSAVLGVHRALGASRAEVFMQRLAECELIGVAGGVLGAGLAALALRAIDAKLPAAFVAENLLVVDGYALGIALLLALGTGLVSGIYPAWRACRVAPAIQLKVN